MKKYYAVKSNTISFIAESWDEAKEKMVGLKEISHKSFTSYEDAKAFLEGNDNKPRFYSEAVAYIDGSYDVNKMLDQFVKINNLGNFKSQETIYDGMPDFGM